MLIVDAHEDLAWNMLTFGRGYTRSAEETCRLEAGGPVPDRNGDTLLGWPDYQRGRVAVVIASLFAAPLRRRLGEWDRLVYANGDQAYDLYRSQLDAYQRLVEDAPDKFRLVCSLPDLEKVLSAWEDEGRESRPVGLVVLMEGAECLREPGELEAGGNAACE